MLTVLSHYLDSIRDNLRLDRSSEKEVIQELETHIEDEVQERWGSREVEIRKVEFVDRHGEPVRSFRTGDPFRVKISYYAHSRIPKPVFGTAIHRNDGTHVNGPNTKLDNQVVEFIEGAGAVWYEIEKLPLLPGTYYFTAVVYNYKCDHPFDHHDQLYPFKVIPGCTDEEYGVFWMPSWKYEGEHGKIIV